MTDTYTAFSKETFAAFRADDHPGPIYFVLPGGMSFNPAVPA